MMARSSAPRTPGSTWTCWWPSMKSGSRPNACREGVDLAQRLRSRASAAVEACREGCPHQRAEAGKLAAGSECGISPRGSPSVRLRCRPTSHARRHGLQLARQTAANGGGWSSRPCPRAGPRRRGRRMERRQRAVIAKSSAMSVNASGRGWVVVRNIAPVHTLADRDGLVPCPVRAGAHRARGTMPALAPNRNVGSFP